MIFIETPIFTKQVLELLTGDEYGEFQQFLMENPLAGDVITGTGGLRKVRWKCSGKGKRGGVRAIYYFVDDADQLRMLFMYSKAEQEDLTPEQCKILKQIKDRWQ